MLFYTVISFLQKIVVPYRMILTSLQNGPINGRWCLILRSVNFMNFQQDKCHT